MLRKAVKLISVYLPVLTILSMCLSLQISCTRKTSSEPNTETFFKHVPKDLDIYLGNKELFEFENQRFDSDDKGQILVSYDKKVKNSGEKLGRFLRLLKNGETVGKEYYLAQLFNGEEINLSVIGFHFVPGGFAAIAKQTGNLFISASKGNLENWSSFVQINDELESVADGVNFLQTSEKDMCFVWTDRRRGWKSLFFSASHDGGKTWSPNQQVEYDYREGAQEKPRLIEGANGRLLLFWHEFRDRKTLLDVRYSYSDDKGLTWVPSPKLNDDEKEVWQIHPSVAADGQNIYVVFSDFREEGEDEDNDWNIYFARSKDNGTTWEKNKRLNNLQPGKDIFPKIILDSEGDLFCLWWSARNTIFGQLTLSYSTDQGKNWSPSVFITDENEILAETAAYFSNISPGKFIVGKYFMDVNTIKSKFFFLERSEEKITNEINGEMLKTEIEPTTIEYEIGEKIFDEDFSDKETRNWKPATGIWNVIEGTYQGVAPTAQKAFIAYLDFEEPEEYILQGKFRLDPVAHTAATIYFRIDEANLQNYFIAIRFRTGAWMCLKDDELPIEYSLSCKKPLAEKRFSFRSDRWYKFKLIVTNDQVDFYIDDRLMFSSKEKLGLPKGKIGIGGWSYSPTYFDDISISKLIR